MNALRSIILVRGLAALACVLPAASHAQVVTNGDFEGSAGTVPTSWITGGTARVAVVQAANFTPTAVPAPQGTRFIALSSGPNAAGGAATSIDGNTTNEFDVVTLSQTVTFAFTPAVLQFRWSFPSSEQDQNDNFDDLLDVSVNNTVVFGRSSCKNNGTSFSPYANAPCNGNTVVNWSIINAVPITGSAMRYGVGAFANACVPIPNTVAGTNTVTIRLRVADQADDGFDSVGLLDAIDVRPACDATPGLVLNQITSTTGSTVERKGVGFEFRPVQSRGVNASQNGTSYAFISSANLDGTNPNVIEQVYTYNGTAFARVSGLAMTSDGNVQAVDMSDEDAAGSANGDFLAISAQLDAVENREIYFFDRQDNQFQTVTASTGCNNTSPSVADNGTRIAFETTCVLNAACQSTGSTAVSKVYLATTTNPGVAAFTCAALPAGAAGCLQRAPRFNRNGLGRYVVLESNCNLATNNADGNVEIFWRDTNGGGTWRQVTTTTGAAINTAPSINGASGTSGQFTFFLSNGEVDTATTGNQNADGSLEIFRYDANANTTTQLTSSTAATVYLGVRATGDTSVDYAFERIPDIITNPLLVEVGRRNNATFANAGATAANEVVVALGDPVAGMDLGIDGTDRLVHFVGVDDYEAGQNTDGNSEVFVARGQ